MKNDAYCCDTYSCDTFDCGTFEKHKELIVEFEPGEVDKEFDVNIKMDDCSCTPCNADGCDNNLLVLLLVILLIRYYNLECGKN